MTKQKEVVILVRYVVKATDSVICTVRNGGGVECMVTLSKKNGSTSCTCKAGERVVNAPNVQPFLP